MGQKQGNALKKSERFEAAGEGLQVLCLARLIGIAVALLNLCPLGGWRMPILVVALFVLAVMELYGFYVARVSHRGFRMAFWVELIGCVAAGVVMLALSKWYRAIRIPLMDSLSLWVVYLLAAATKELLTQKGDNTWAKGADWLCWGYGLLLAVDMGLMGLAFAPAPLQQALPVAAIGTTRSVFGVVLSLGLVFFCFQSSRSLRR